MGSLLGGGAGAAGGSPLGAVGPLLQAFGGVDAATVKVRAHVYAMGCCA